MIAWISSWAGGIVIAIIISTIIEMILPEGNNKKYIKTVIGVFILFVIVSPVISKFTNEKFEFNNINYEEYFNTKNYEVSANTIVEANDRNIENVYLSGIKGEITNGLNERGYKINNLHIDIELKDEKNYGNIKSIKLSVIKSNDEKTNSSNNDIKSVNKVDIGNINKNDNVKEENKKAEITSEDERKIKEYLNNTYQINKNNITIER